MTREISGTAAVNGPAWSARAREWSELQEPRDVPLYEAVLGATKVGAGTRLLDVGCGSGLAASMAAALGATVSGIDAAEGLIEIARERTPAGDFRTGDLEALPFDDASFDVVVAFNSIQFAADPANAAREAARVTKLGGLVAIAVWGRPEDNEQMSIGAAVRRALPQTHSGAPPFRSDQPALSELVSQAGLTPGYYQEIRYCFDYADLATAVSAGQAPGSFQSALAVLGPERFNAIVEEAFKPFVKPDGHVRTANTMVFMVARK